MNIRIASRAGTLLLVGLAATSAQAATYDLNLVLTNAGFESGLAGWSYSGQAVNANTYLTGPAAGTEWANQTWSSSSPFAGYTDAFLAATYPGQPWGLNPAITHLDQSTISGDPTAVIAAALGSNFVGSRQDGYEGHCLNGGSVCGAQTAFYDTNLQLYQAIVGTFNVGDVFNLTIWGNRGRLNQDWSQANANTTGNESRITAAVCSQANLNNPCGSGAVQTFTNWGSDGPWTSQTLSWTLASVAASQDIRVQLTGINQNHDRYVALDVGAAVVPVPGAVWLLGSAIGLMSLIRRRISA
jgi:hypothetical protein